MGAYLPEETAILKAVIREGGTFHDAVRQIPERSPDALRKKMVLLRQKSPAQSTQSPDTTPEIREALASYTGKKPNVKPTVEPEWKELDEPQTRWALAEKENAKKIEHALKRSLFSVDFPDTDPVAFSFISDQHIAPGTPVDLERMRKDAETIAETPNAYALLGGDGVDNHIKHRGAIIAARSQPGDQYELFEHYLGTFSDSILALISGNHDAWTDQTAGVDMIQAIAKRQKICYCPAEAHLAVTVGGQRYDVSFRHQYRFNSSMNQCHAVKQWYRFGERQFDIGCVCHHHEPSIESFIAHGFERWACRPGAYQISSAYSRQYGYNSTYPTCPTFILYPGERRIAGFQDLQMGLRFLRSELGV